MLEPWYARGADVSESWARKMIEHHRGALEMSEVLLRQDPNSIYAPTREKGWCRLGGSNT
jgi:hypothetical protein